MKYYIDGCSFACDWTREINSSLNPISGHLTRFSGLLSPNKYNHISWSHYFENKINQASPGKSNISIFHDTFQAMEKKVADRYLVMFTYSERQEIINNDGGRNTAYGIGVYKKDLTPNEPFLSESRKYTENYIKTLIAYSKLNDIDFKFITVEPSYCFEGLDKSAWFNSELELEREEHDWFFHNLITIYGCNNYDLIRDFCHLGVEANKILYKDIKFWLDTGRKPPINYSRQNTLFYLKDQIDGYYRHHQSYDFLKHVIDDILKKGFIYER